MFNFAIVMMIVLTASIAMGQATSQPATAPSTENLIANGDFSKGEIGQMPEGWTAVTPNPALAPQFKLVAGPDGTKLLMGQGNGKQECLGLVACPVKLQAKKTYLMEVRFKVEGIEDLHRSLLHGVFGGTFCDGIFEYRRDGEWIVGESRFDGPKKLSAAKINLCLRYTPAGKVYWKSVSIRECEPIAPRLVKIAVSWGTGTTSRWEKWLDAAGAAKVDIALLPEGYNGAWTLAKAQPIDGPAGTLMSDKARQYKMYVSGSFYEKRGELCFNTAPLFDRSGKLVGQYDKVHPYDPELTAGVTPGKEFPVFQTDFGKVGTIICYDSWFPQTVQILAVKGAELVLFPNAGYFEDLMTARAADNGVWIACSSLSSGAGVWDSAGYRAGEELKHANFAPTSIVSVEKDAKNRMLVVTVDLSRKYSPNPNGGPMGSAPGGRRVRNTSFTSMDEELLRLSRTPTLAPTTMPVAAR